MTIFGYTVDFLLLFQVGTTTIIVGVYAMLTSLGERRADHQSDCQMILLISFVAQEHPNVRSLSDVVEVRDVDKLRQKDTTKYFSEYYDNYKISGTLPSYANAQSSTMTENIIALIITPLFSILILFLFVDWYRRNVFRIRTTELRKNYFSKLVLLAVGGIGYLLLATVMLNELPKIAVIFMFLGAISILLSVIGIAILTLEQQAWKTYWSDRLLEILAAQDREEAHDQFNRALLLSNFLNEQPDVPFPGRLGLYTGIYSVVQALILVVNSQLSG